MFIVRLSIEIRFATYHTCLSDLSVIEQTDTIDNVIKIFDSNLTS